MPTPMTTVSNQIFSYNLLTNKERITTYTFTPPWAVYDMCAGAGTDIFVLMTDYAAWPAQWKLVSIDTATWTELGTLIIPVIYRDGIAAAERNTLYFDGTYIYCPVDTNKVAKINPATMLVVATYTRAVDAFTYSFSCLAGDAATHRLFISWNRTTSTNALIEKLSTVTMTLAGSWIDGIGSQRYSSLVADASHVYARTNNIGLRIKKIDAVTMALDFDYSSLAPNQDANGGLVLAAGYVYGIVRSGAGLGDASVEKIIKATMTLSDAWTGVALDEAYYLVLDDVNGFLFVWGAPPNKFTKISMTTMLTDSQIYVPTTYNYCVNATDLLVPRWGLGEVVTDPASAITDVDAQGHGEITDIYPMGGWEPSERGFVWNTTGDPTIADSIVTDAAGPFGLGIFDYTLTPLLPSTTYHVRAYILSPAGYQYGTEVIFTTSVAPIVRNPNAVAYSISRRKL